MVRRLLVVCTANTCRSPVAERLLRRALADTRDVDGGTWTVSSAGTGEYNAALDPNTIRAAAAAGVDITDHLPRTLDEAVLAGDGEHLVLTMERAHIPVVVSLERDAWTRTFTLKELARRARQLDPPDPAEGFAGWIKRMAAGRKAAALLRPDPADDIADPYGLAPVYHARMVDELRDVIHQLIRWGPWS